MCVFTFITEMLVLALGKVAALKQDKRQVKRKKMKKEGKEKVEYVFVTRNPSKRSFLVGVNLWRLDEKSNRVCSRCCEAQREDRSNAPFHELLIIQHQIHEVMGPNEGTGNQDG
jgi:hypothetical protein